MDAVDRKILAVVQEDASLSVAEVGQRVGLSSTPCWKRLQRLEADGVIMRRTDHALGIGSAVVCLIRSIAKRDVTFLSGIAAISFL